MRSITGGAIFLSCLLATLPALGQQADGANGRALSERYCASCHLIGADQPGPATDGVPTFRAMANDPAMNEARLKGFMKLPHPLMPDLSLTRREIDDIAAYIAGMKAR
ncbi:MAG: c-type cytochrome [Alphaproteobacteria bacterium]|nr:c-type cytochrome [Alphaproteobacteria bacterium]